jgi:hypothetical protein
VGEYPSPIVVNDFNGDGNDDLAVTNTGGNSVSVLIGKGDGTFAKASEYSVGSYPNCVAAGDFTGDGKADIAAVNSANGTVSILTNKGDGTFAKAVNLVAGGGGPISIVAVDINKDKSIDLALCNAGTNNISVLVNDGKGNFADPVLYPSGISPVCILVDDFNKDGYWDFLTVNNNETGSISVFLGCPAKQ